MKKQKTGTSEQVSSQAATDAEDGKEIQLKADSKTEDENFFKIFMKDFEKGLDKINSKQLKLILWLIKHMSLKNEINKSYREIAKASGMSLQTVTTTINLLEQGDFLCRNGTGLIINPDAVFKGRRTKREQVRYAYSIAKTEYTPLSEIELEKAAEELENTKEQLKNLIKRQKELEELKDIEKKIKQLTYEKKKLSEKIEYTKWIRRSENAKKNADMPPAD